jgi:hypothetical protein
MPDVKKFILVTHPRSGSTYLIRKLAEAVGAILPDVTHEEIFNPYDKLRNCHLLHLDISSELAIVNGFFARANEGYIGFKTMPVFHREGAAIADRDDIQFITLHRKDVVSALASYLVSEKVFDWNKSSRDQLGGKKLVLQEMWPDLQQLELQLQMLLERQLFNYRAIHQLNQRMSTIPITTEWLVHPGVSDERTTEFFGCRIPYDGFISPTHYTECFEDHDFFKETVLRLFGEYTQFDSDLPPAIQAIHPSLNRTEPVTE